MNINPFHRLFLILIVLISNELNSQNKSEVNFFNQFSITLGGLRSANEFNKLGDVPNCCDSYENGSGYSLISNYNYGLAINRTFALRTGAFIMYDNIDLDKKETILTRDGNQLINHFANSQRLGVGIELGLDYIIESFFVTASLNTNYYLINQFSQYEELNSYDGSFKPNSENKRNIFENQNSNFARNFTTFITASIYYEIDIQKRKDKLVPFLKLRRSIVSEHEDSWNITGIYIGISFKRNTYYTATPIRLR